MKSAGKARNNGLYRHIRTSKEIIRNLLNDSTKYILSVSKWQYFLRQQERSPLQGPALIHRENHKLCLWKKRAVASKR